MKPVDLNVNHIAEVKIRNFADLSNPSVEQTAVVKVNHNTFKVTISATGDVNVSFNKFGFFNIFRSDSKNRLAEQIRSQIDKWKTNIAEPDIDALKTTIANDTSKKLAKYYDVNNETGYADVRNNEIAVYGFSNLRAMNAEDLVENHNVSYSMIDDYNRGIGIKPGALGLLKLGENLNNIKNGTCDINPPEEDYSVDKITKWMNFLRRPENFRKIDILGRLREYIAIATHPTKDDKQATGWRGEFARNGLDKAMEIFVRKNLPGEGLKIDMDAMGNNVLEINDNLVPLLADALKLIATKGNGNLTEELVESCIREAARDGGLEVEDPHVYALKEALNLIVDTALFRQTSKLGLDFFKETNTPVMFYWTNHKGHTLPNNTRTLNDKWWKNTDESIKKHYGASITFSEMRHVQKMLKVMPKAEELFNEDEHPFTLIKIAGQLV